MIETDAARACLASLLEADPAVAYLAARDLQRLEGAPLEKRRQRALTTSPLLGELRASLARWPGAPLASHKSAEQAFHALAFAAELGLRRGDPGVAELAAAVLAHPSPEGPFELPLAISEAHGGTGATLGAWALCDAPVILRALVRLDYGREPPVQRAAGHLAGLAFSEGGWPCATSASLKGWRGPGKKADPCPYGSLVMLELLLELSEAGLGSFTTLIQATGEVLLRLWAGSRELHPYMFFMGKDFRKLKAPLLWYDLLHVLDALARIPGFQGDPRLLEMLELLEGKFAPGGWTPESVYLRWKAYDFGQKKLPSALLSTLALRILLRSGRLEASAFREGAL